MNGNAPNPNANPCTMPDAFPAVIVNRPSLPRIRYRIGLYSDFRASMLAALDRSPLLDGWTHRSADDPGIALLEGAAILGDILTFYQELYANEAWLGTAVWPESVAALVRLIGYRPAPGMGGVGLAAFEIGGSSPVTVPQGFPFSAQIAGMSAPADFETSASMVAVPALSRFSLYAPSEVTGIYQNAGQIAANAAGLAAAGVALQANDRLMLVDPADAQNRQIVVVKSVATVLDQVVLTLTGAWQGQDAAGGSMTAYKLGRSFRAFGYNAPATEFDLNAAGQLVSSTVDTTVSLGGMLAGFPLERQVNDLSAGITMLLDLMVTSFKKTSNSFRSLTALSVKSDTDSVGPMQGGITRVSFTNGTSGFGEILDLLSFTDRRTAICHEVVGSGFSVTGVRRPVFAADLSQLDFLGDGATYNLLDGRLVQFVALNPDDTAARVEEAVLSIDRSATGDPSQIALRRLSLTPALTQFTPADFPLSNPGIVVFGNVAAMTQGKTQPVAVLGNGDARQIFQSFQLPKAPLTWLENEALTPSREAEVTLLVNQIEWAEVDSLFASGPGDQVYILREDQAGNTWVQFGDGIHGARLPSGVGNVTALYRSGNAANGWRQSGTKPQANGRVPNLTNLRLYNEVTRGTADEDSSHIRQTAPGRVQELGRIVSLSDFEFEALSLPSVEKALATWDTEDNVPLLKLMVLLSEESPAQLGSVQTAISQANAVRGADRFSVLVAEASLEYVYVSVTVGLTVGYQAAPVLEAVAAALGVLPSDGSSPPTGGLFSLDRRSLGQEEYASRIEGAVQNVEGVSWAAVKALGSLGSANDPSTLVLPSPPGLSPTLSCAGDRVLALYAAHFSAMAGDA